MSNITTPFAEMWLKELKVSSFFLTVMHCKAIWLFSCLAFSAGACHCIGQDLIYTVDGKLVCKHPLLNKTSHVIFTITVSNCSWSITGSASDVKDVTFKEVHDGDITTSAALFSEKTRNASGIGNDSALGIEQSDTPNCMPPIGAGPVWLAYGSACKLSGSTGAPMELVWAVDQELVRTRFKTRASWVLASASPFLPSEFNYWYDAESFYRALSQPAPTPLSSDENTPWASYRVLGFTNVGGLLLPKAFEFLVYITGSKKQVLTSYRGDLTRAYRTLPTAAFKHGFGTKTFVQDERFVSEAAPAAFVRYVTTNSVIAPTNDPDLLKRAIHADLSQIIDHGQPMVGTRRSSLGRSVAFCIIIGALVLFPFVIMLARKAGGRSR